MRQNITRWFNYWEGLYQVWDSGFQHIAYHKKNAPFAPFLPVAKTMREKLTTLFAGRPIWMNLLMLFCAYMTFIYMPFDLFFKPVAEDVEVWFGYSLYGWAAKATEPLHWLIYGAGCYGFFKMKPWMWPWAALYVFQVAIAMYMWGVLSGKPYGPMILIAAAPFVVLSVMLLLARSKFGADEQTRSTQR